jgi:acyl carrier protein
MSRYPNTPDHVAALTEIWRKVLGNLDLDADSDIFENGGSSLHVLQIVGHIYDTLGAEVKLRDVFSHASPQSLSSFIEDVPGRWVSSADGTNS